MGLISEKLGHASTTPRFPLSRPLTSRNYLSSRWVRAACIASTLLVAFGSLWMLARLDVLGSYGSAGPIQGPDERPINVASDRDSQTRSLIPAKIWQILLPKPGAADKKIDPENLKETTTWLAKNVDYQYQLVGPRRADDFVDANFADRPDIIKTYHSLANLGMKSDLLRYLILYKEGGVYTDIDTVAIRPISAWIPPVHRSTVRLITGIEFDKLDGPNWADIPHDLQFCQWTIAAAPGHPVFMNMVDRIISSVKKIEEEHDGKPISEIVPSSLDVMNSTGPAAWTDIVFETLQGFDPSLRETKDLRGMTEPLLYGDVLVLSINGFGMGQQHSDSKNDGSIPPDALMRHLFWGSWREPRPAAPAETTGDKTDEEKKKQEEEERKKQEEEERKKQEEEERKKQDEEAARLQAEREKAERKKAAEAETERLKNEAEEAESQSAAAEAARASDTASPVVSPEAVKEKGEDHEVLITDPES